MVIETVLKVKNIILPNAAAPAANYVPYVIHQNTVYISGQLPLGIGELKEYVGVVGKDVSVEKAKEVARICGLNVIAQLRNACDGDLNRVERCIRLGVFVNSASDFTEHPAVANGASDLMVEVFGEKGKHARATVGVSQLPRGAAVEVEAVFSIK